MVVRVYMCVCGGGGGGVVLPQILCHCGVCRAAENQHPPIKMSFTEAKNGEGAFFSRNYVSLL